MLQELFSVKAVAGTCESSFWNFSGELKPAGFVVSSDLTTWKLSRRHAREYVREYVYACVMCRCICTWTIRQTIFWQYSSGSTPLTGMEAGLLTTTTSSSMCITVIGSEVTGTSCLQHTNRNQLNVALFRLRLQVSHNTYVVHVRNARRRTHVYTHAHIHTRTYIRTYTR